MAKYKVGLQNYKPLSHYGVNGDISRVEDDVLYGKLFEEAITVLKNKNSILPLRNLETKKIAYVTLGDDKGSDFYNELKKYTKVHKVSAENLNNLLEKLKNYNTVLLETEEIKY